MTGQDIDNRIVQMQFDARDFDKNIRKSQKTLDDFQKSLNFDDAARQMQNIATATAPLGSAITEMANNVGRLANEFLGVGKVSTYIAQKVKKAWQDALNSVESFAKSMTTVQINQGKIKYEGLLRSVQTIKNATGDTEEYVYDVMKTLNKYTDETSYDFADMADNIGKFTTAGVNLKDAEAEMEGIANWAAFAGQGVNEAKRAMYNISQAMSAGSMRLVDYKSIQNANMDIRSFRQEALEAAVAAGTLTKSADGVYKTVKGGKEVNLENFTETLQFKWFDKATMEAVFKTFADNTKGVGKEAYKAAQRCVTLTDVLNAWKDMISTGWMKSYELLFGKLSDAMGLFSGLCNKASEELDKLISIRNGILEGWATNGGRNSLFGALFGELETPDGEILFKGAYGFLDALRDVGEAIREAFWDFVGEFINPANKSLFNQDKEGYGMAFLSAKLAELSQRFQNFTGKIKDFLFTANEGETETRFDRIKNVAKAIFSVVTLVVNVISGIASFAGKIISQLHPAISAVEQLISWLAQMFTGQVVAGAKSNAIGNFFSTLAEILRPVTTIINVAVRAIVNLVASLITTAKQSGLLQTLGSIFKYLSTQLSGLVMKVLNSGALQKVFGWIQNGITKLPGFIAKIKEFAAVLFTTFKGSKTYKNISDFFKNTFSAKNLKGLTSNLKNTIKSLAKKIPELFQKLFGGMSTNLGAAFQSIFGIGTAGAEGSEQTTEVVAEALAKPIEAVAKGNVISKALDKAKPGILDNFKAKLTEIWGTITGFFTTLANSEGIKKIKNFFAGTNFTTLLSGATGLIKWLAIFRTGSGLVSIGKGAKSLGKGLKFIGKNFKNLNFADMFKNMFNISNIINSNNNTKSLNFGKLGNQLLQIAAAIGIVAYSASIITKMSDDELIKAGKSIGIIIGSLVAAGFLAKKFTGNGGSLMALAAGVMILMVPMNILKREPWDQILDSAAKLGLVIAAIALAGSLSGGVKMKGFVGLALAVNMLLIPLKALSKMSLMGVGADMNGSLVKAIAALEILILTMAGAAQITGGNKMKGMLGLAAALTLMMIPIKMIGNMKLGNAIQGVGLLAALMASITGMVKLTNNASVAKLAGLVGAVTALSFVAWLVGHTIDWKQALVGFGGISIMITSMALFLRQASKMDVGKLKQVRNIMIGFSAFVAVAAGAIIVMDQLKVDWKMVAAFLGGITAVVVALGVMLPILGKMDPKTAVTGILALAAAVAAIMGAVALMIPVVIGSVTSSMTNLINIAARLKSMSGLLKDFFDRMDAISDASVSHAISTFDQVRLMIMGFGEFGKYDAHLKSVLSQLTYLGAGLDALFVNESKYPANFEDTRTYKLLNKLMEMAPSLVAFSIGSLPEELLSLGVGVMLFNEAAGRITSTNPPALTLLQGIFDQAENIRTFTSLPLESFSGQMSALGGAMSLYAKGAAEVTGLAEDGSDIPDISKSVEILKAVCMAISGEDGSGEFKIPENMPNSFELGLFSSQLQSLGNALSTYANAAKDMETDTGNAMALLKFLAEIGGYLTPANLEVVNAFDDVGHASSTGAGGKLNQFALDIGAIGVALSSFAEGVTGKESQFSEGLKFLDHFEELNQKLTVDNLKFASVFNDAGIHKSALDVFQVDIGALGHAIASFAQNAVMDDGTKADFNYALQALDFLAGIQNRLPDLGGIHQIIYGQKENLDKLATDVQLIGNSIHEFNLSIVGASEGDSKFDVTAVTDAVDFLRSLVQVIGVLNTTVIPTDNAFADDYGDLISNFSNLMSIMNGEWGNDSMIDSLANYAKKITTVFNEVGGIDAQAVSTFKDVAEGLVSLITMDTSGNFTFPGKMISEGVATGIEEGRSRVVQAAVAVVQAAIDAANKTAGIASPSKIFAQMGEFMDAGLVKGLINKQSTVESASSDVMSAAMDNASSILAIISQAMAETIDEEPTITPVLDLSQVMSSQSALDSMFGDYSLNLRSSLNRAAALSNNGPVSVVVQNPTDLSGVYSSVADLRAEIVGLKDSVTNMRIVLDTGVIAGGVTDGVDRNMGQKNLYASRRN